MRRECLSPAAGLVIFVVVVTVLLLAGCITTFFSVGLPLLTDICK